jgi:protein-disulfide isomerase
MENPPETPAPLLPPKSENTITFKRSHLYAVMLPLAFVLGLSVGFLFWGRNQAEPPQGAASAPAVAAQDGQVAAPTQQPFRRYDVPTGDNPSLGPADAAITIIEFSDYQCPYCRKWELEAWPKIQAAYPGKIRLVYRDFPLYSIHPESEAAAIAADCAGDQQKYWEFHDLLFSDQLPLGQDSYVKYAAQVKLNVDQFTQCVTTQKFKDNVSSNYNYASNLGVNSTPTFFVNGIPMVGAQPFEAFKVLIDKELAGKIPK